MRVVDNVGFNVKKQDIPGGGSGSGNGQPLATPDYLQNDETAADYIKNRPFYTTDPVETELVNGTFAFTSPREGLYVNGDITTELTEGETYKASIDGVEYETVCQSFSGMLYIGSIEIITGGTPKSPFVYTPADGSFATNIEGVSHEIVIKSFAQEVVKIDAKYLPDTVVQPDWNQNDDTQPDYVKNRPFYTASVETELVNGEFAFAYNTKLGCYTNRDIKIELTEGEAYKVTLDSVEYETVCQVFQEGVLYIGASEILNGGTPPSNMPFAYTKASNGYTTFATTTGNFHEIIIKSIKSQIIPIPEQYIPEMSSVTLLSSTAGSTKKFKITVDDSGTLKATEVTG